MVAKIGNLVLCLLLLVGLVLGWLFWSIERDSRRHRQALEDVRSLASKRPAGVTEAQWTAIVHWTNNAIANCLTMGGHKSTQDCARFVDELHRRVAGPVDLHTIDQIWDDLIRSTQLGQDYSDRYRPTTPERMREASL